MFQALLRWFWPEPKIEKIPDQLELPPVETLKCSAFYKELIALDETIDRENINITDVNVEETVQNCKAHAPDFIFEEEEKYLTSFFELMLRFGLLTGMDIIFGYVYLKEIFKHFPVNENDDHKVDKCFLQSVMAFMFASKGAYGDADSPYDNATFHTAYSYSLMRNEAEVTYCKSLVDFKKEERRIFYKINGYPDQIKEATDWEFSPNKPEMTFTLLKHS